MKSYIFRNKTPCSPLKDNRRFGGICRCHLQVRRRGSACYKFHAGFLFWAYISILKMESTRSSEKFDWFLVDYTTLYTGRCNISSKYIIHESSHYLTIYSPADTDKVVQKTTKNNLLWFAVIKITFWKKRNGCRNLLGNLQDEEWSTVKPGRTRGNGKYLNSISDRTIGAVRSLHCPAIVICILFDPLTNWTKCGVTYLIKLCFHIFTAVR
jgi:hypothetical protein